MAAVLLLLSACSDANPLAPTPPEEARVLSTLACSVDVRAGTLSCQQQPLPSGAHFNKIYGGQERFVKLTSSGTAYDSGTEILSSNVTVENLLDRAIGTADGSTVGGVNVVFQSDPATTSGTGVVTVMGDGTGIFTAPNQAYYLYNQIISTYEISAGRQWQFSVPSTVNTFSFTVFISAPMPDESGPVSDMLDRVWTGSADSAWSNAANWENGAAPDSASVVAIPADSLLASPIMPQLTAEGDAAHLRVGFGSTLQQAGFALRVRGNVDAVGTVSGGTLTMSGTGARLKGNVGSLAVTGSTLLQGATRTTGAISVTGSLSLNGNALSISVP